MIAIRLLGGARKAVGKPLVELYRDSATISEILQFLQDVSSEPRLLQPGNLIVSVNGVDSNAVAGADTVAKSGDEVIVVTVVHGG